MPRFIAEAVTSISTDFLHGHSEKDQGPFKRGGGYSCHQDLEA